MNNDLISREALYNEVDTWGCNDYDKYDFLDAIVNAPTVEPKKEIVPVCKVTFDKEQLQEIVDKKVAEMIERPQGEWEFKKITDDYRVYGRCSICKQRKRIDNFCPNCGAKMEKGGAE